MTMTRTEPSSNTETTEPAVRMRPVAFGHDKPCPGCGDGGVQLFDYVCPVCPEGTTHGAKVCKGCRCARSMGVEHIHDIAPAYTAALLALAGRYLDAEAARAARWRRAKPARTRVRRIG